MLLDSYSYFDLQSAISKGEAYLWSQLGPTGWSDFLTPIGESIEWVTGYVLSCLGDNDEKKEAIKRIASHLCFTQRNNGGWGYNPKAPADADSTSSVLTAFAGTDYMPRKNIQKAVKFLLKLQDKAVGGFKTFGFSLHLRLLIGSFGISYKGWSSPHLDVTSAAVIALNGCHVSIESDILRNAKIFLKQSMNNDGLWRSYWWRGPFYGTSITCHALSLFEDKSLDFGKTKKSLIALQLQDGSWNHLSFEWGCAFATALSLSALVSLGSSSWSIKLGTKWLLDHQNIDGSWASVPIMQIPYPWDKCPPISMVQWTQDGLGTGVLIRDQNRLFTTATVVRTLRKIRMSYVQNH
jgi:squalene cyclase